MHIINVTVRDKIATHVDGYYVCGNSDFVVHFDFDEEWAALDVKTARFICEDGSFRNQVFSGNECPVPIISNTNNIRVGVFAGNLCTTTPARVPAAKSILCPGGMPAAPGDDTYNQIMEELNGVKTALDVGKGLYIVGTIGPADEYSPAVDRSQDEIRAAVSAGKTVLLVGPDGKVYTYVGEYSVNGGDVCPQFFGYMEYVSGTLQYKCAEVTADGRINRYGNTKVKTPTPHKLTIKQGETTSTYDGSGAVSITIEAGGDGAYIINATHDAEGRLYADKTASEVRAAVAAGEMCLLYIDDGRVFSYFGEVFESLAGGTTPTFAGTAFFDDTRRQMSFPLMHIKENKNVVGVNSNFPLPTGPAMYLTSNKYGYPIWEDINLLVKALPVPGDATSTGYLRWNGSAWEAATIDQLKADLGLA